ncbi:hypothetical protein ACFUYE_08255 [Micromonospora humida]|uniref:hypothetical protein n=1 Tax=Micromonospora humida TaxID=2809018 RepID=UPI00366E494C
MQRIDVLAYAGLFQHYYNRLEGAPGVNVLYHDATLCNSIYRFDDEMLINMHVLGFPAITRP